MNSLRYAVYVSGSGTNIKKVLQRKINLISKIKIIITDNANIELEELCKQKNIKYKLYVHEDTVRNKSESFSDYLLTHLIGNKIDFCFSFGTCILKGKLLEIYKNKIINFHPSLLPHFAGLNAIDKAIESNVKIIGNTAHFIDENIDTGPIILQNVVHVENFLNNGYEVILEEQIVLMEKIDILLTEDRLHVIDNKVLIDNANYTKSNIYPDI
ncbi:MAG: hypothetical protein IKW30_10045 [Lachnospiraceae bacterium]|nr:hypothetical protein [Lachnospiraceae bacterium]